MVLMILYQCLVHIEVMVFPPLSMANFETLDIKSKNTIIMTCLVLTFQKLSERLRLENTATHACLNASFIRLFL